MKRLNEKQLELARSISEECTTVSDVTELLKELFAGTLEQMLEAEIEEHLGYEKHSAQGDNTGNSRNGFNKKTLKSEWGEVELCAPRDRNGTFEPKLIKTRQTRTEDLENRVLAMYGKGMSPVAWPSSKSDFLLRPGTRKSRNMSGTFTRGTLQRRLRPCCTPKGIAASR